MFYITVLTYLSENNKSYDFFNNVKENSLIYINKHKFSISIKALCSFGKFMPTFLFNEL